MQLIEQHPGLLQIKRVETLGEPAVNGSEQFASWVRFALVAPEARETCGSAKLKRLRALPARTKQLTP